MWNGAFGWDFEGELSITWCAERLVASLLKNACCANRLLWYA